MAIVAKWINYFDLADKVEVVVAKPFVILDLVIILYTKLIFCQV